MDALYQLSYVGGGCLHHRTAAGRPLLDTNMGWYRLVPKYRVHVASTVPDQVHEATKEKVRYAALMAGLKQAELVERAVDEYVERHREDFAQRMEQAQEALLGGKSATLAYSLGVSEEDVQRVGDVASDQIGAQAKARDLEPCQLTRGPARTRLPQLGLGRRQDQAEEHIPQALLNETSVGCLSPDRNPNLEP